MSKGIKIFLVVAMVVLAALMVVAIAWQNGWQRISILDSSIKIGFIAPLSGDAAVYGIPGKNVVAMAVQEINTAGGINGKPLEVIYVDGKCTPAGGAAAMQELVATHQVKVVIGGFCSSESLAAISIAAANNVTMLSPASSSPDLTGVSPFFFRNYPSDAAQGRVLAEAAYTQKKFKKVAFIQEQSDYPVGIYRAFASRFEQLGGIVTKEEFAKDTTDFVVRLTTLRQGNPDALFVDTQTPASAERIFATLTTLKWKPFLLVSDVVPGDTDTISRNSSLLEGALLAEFDTDENNTRFQTMRAAYLRKYSEDMPYQSYGQTEYDAAYLVRDALLNVGNDAQKIAAWLRGISRWQGASGSITIGPDGDRVSGHSLRMIKNGEVVPFVP